MVHYRAGSSHQTMGTCQGMDMISTNTQVYWSIYTIHYARLGLSCAQKIFLTALHQQHSKLLMQGSMDHSFMLFMPNSDTTI